MAKNRRIPFGYQMINGEITTHPREVYAVSKIFAEYLKGRSMLDISKDLQAEGIPYHPCEDSTWNKNMIKRILENEKYLGTEIYPQIISPDIFHRANNKKLKKATNICIVPDELKEIRNMTICAECRKMLFRNQNGTWTCKTYRCGAFELKATDQMILSAVLNMLNSATKIHGAKHNSGNKICNRCIKSYFKIFFKIHINSHLLFIFKFKQILNRDPKIS